jgi:hypothetical protein
MLEKNLFRQVANVASKTMQAASKNLNENKNFISKTVKQRKEGIKRKLSLENQCQIL